MSASLPITPDTKVGELLEAYPQLEEVFVRQSPHFKALKNPILRRTVAKVATLAKAAQMGGIPIRQLILALRQAAGQPTEELAAMAADESPAATLAAAGPPDWLDTSRVRVTIDAEALLAAGEHPLGRVQHAVRELAEGDLLCLQSAFRPIPLVELLERGGHRAYVQEAAPGAYRTYVVRGK
ncbi:MAG: DUF1858 domain-containing protein [candidate division NC10 bacterium]|nr:DUF1858 domain-containing protein [candidate division NC10 bacterium]